MEKRVLVPLAEGFEMIEALSLVDVFRRAGVRVDTAAVGGSLQVTSSHQVPVIADTLLSDCLDRVYDLIVLPGGLPGAENLRQSSDLAKLLQAQHSQNRLYGAICAAPALVLEPQGLLKGKRATCHPNFAGKLSSQGGVGARVVVDGNCITSRGAGTAIDFALELLAVLLGTEKRKEVEKQMALVDEGA
jgi:4-methyl-5(b-hydroxyethyl)-thiazole monophosphate biosynthesis